MCMCRVPSRLLAVALLLVGECSGGLGPAAEAAAHSDFAAPAQHGALPPQVQAMVAQLAETVEALRSEVLELKADRGRSQERAAALETRVGELEKEATVHGRRVGEGGGGGGGAAGDARRACQHHGAPPPPGGAGLRERAGVPGDGRRRDGGVLSAGILEKATGAFSRPRASCRTRARRWPAPPSSCPSWRTAARCWPAPRAGRWISSRPSARAARAWMPELRKCWSR